MLDVAGVSTEGRLRRVESMVLLLTMTLLDGDLNENRRRILSTKMAELQKEIDETNASEDRLRAKYG